MLNGRGGFDSDVIEMEKGEMLVVTPARVPSRAASVVGITSLANALAVRLAIPVRFMFVRPMGVSSLEADRLIRNDLGLHTRIPVDSIPSTGNRYWDRLLFTISVGRILRRRPVRGVVTRSIPAVWVAVQSGVPVVYDAHDFISPHRTLLWYALRSVTGKSSFKTLAVTNVRLERMYLDAGIDPNVIRVIRHATEDVDRLDPWMIPESARQYRLHAGYCGSLSVGRGIEIIVSLATRMPEVCFWVFGGSDLEVQEWRRGSEHLGNLRFWGHVPHRQVAAKLKSMDILLAPYQNQVFIESGVDTAAWMSPLKLVEYLAAGKPIVASRLPAVMEVLDHGAGIVVKPDDVDEWVRAIDQLFDHRRRGHLSCEAIRRFRDDYTWDKRASEILESLGVGDTLVLNHVSDM